MGVFDWFRRRGGRTPETPIVWHVYLDGVDVVAEDGRGGVQRAAVTGARHVRVVPLMSGDHHATSQAGGWQVTLSRAEGDVLLGGPLQDWRVARELALLVSEKTELPLDELTQRMFSRVGQYTPSAQN